MQHNTDGRRKRERQIVDNIRPRSYHDQHLQHPAANAPLLSRIRNFNHLALTSIGSFFSGPRITKAAVHLHQNEEKKIGRDPTIRYGNENLTDANRHSSDESYFWLEGPQGCLPSPENDNLTPVGNDYYNAGAGDCCSVKQLPSERRLETHNDLDSSDWNAFPLDAGALAKDDPLPVQRAGLSHAHILTCHSVHHLFGGSHCPDTLAENDIRDTYISAECSNLNDPGQNLRNSVQLKSSTATPGRAAGTTLSATAAVFVPSSPAARALLSRNKSSMAFFQTNVTGPDTVSVDTRTPPLTPDSSNAGLLSPASFSASFEHAVPSHVTCTPDSSDRMPGKFILDDDDSDKILYTSPQLLEVKEGKKRAQSSAEQINYEVSLRPLGLIAAPAPASDDFEEWYGLEYTLELSSRERQPSDTQSFSAGEHSKSRESWAAIHRGTIHPFFEDEDYYQWKNWHRLLDKQDERRKHKKGFAFKARSKDLSCLFVDEMRTRDILYWQKEAYGFVTREVKERLNYITANCPDPYFPLKKHDLGWYLKRSRSIGCMRELQAIEDGIAKE